MSPWPAVLPDALDILVGVVVLLYAIHGFRHGWLISLVELTGFMLALFMALALYAPLSRELVSLTSLPYGVSKPIAFLLIWSLSDLLYGVLTRGVLANLWWTHRRPTLDRLLGIFPGAARGVLVAMVVLTAIASVPFPGPIASAIHDSRVSQALQPRGSVLADQFSQVFGEAVQETIGLLTVRPESTERVELRFRVSNPAIDPLAETRMLELVNRERAQRGVRPLQADETLRQVAREHSREMFQRGYFAHVDPDGSTPFDRMREGGARFRAAGENLALAPTVEVAHNGLMNSPGHRANILNPAFGRVGIGVEDGGLHGKMFTQNFAD
jgi:uncharacterized protein YkwD